MTLQESTNDAAGERDGFRIVALGILSVLAVFLFSAWKWNSAADVSTAVGSITGVIGTLVGAFFGIQIGSNGKEKAEQGKNLAETRLSAMRAVLPITEAEKLRQSHPSLFRDFL